MRTWAKGKYLLGAVVALALVCVGPMEASGDSRGKAGREIVAGMAEVDSLLVADPSAALGRARSLHATHGDDPLYGWQTRGRLAMALMAADRPEEALPHLEFLVRHEPTDPVWHRNLAGTLRVLGKRGRALTEYGLVVELDPRDFRARLEYGQYLLEFRNFSLAAHHLQEASRLCGDCDEAQRALVNLYLTRGDYVAAADPLLKISRTDTTEAVARSLLVALSRSGRNEELLVVLEERGMPNLSPVELRLVVDAEGNLGRDMHSLAFATSLGEGAGRGAGFPDDGGFWGRVALNLLATGRYSEGLLAVEKAIALEGENVTHRNNRVVLLLRLGRDDEAALEWEEVLQLDPSLKQEKTP